MRNALSTPSFSVEGLSRLLLPRVNPLILIGWAGFGLVLLSDLLLDLDNSHSVDTWAAIVFSVIFFGTMFPMSAYAGKILLQVFIFSFFLFFFF